MIASLYHQNDGVNWEELQRRAKLTGFAIGFFGLGVWADGIYNGTAKLPWLHQQAAVLNKVQTQVVPSLKAEVHCEHKRAETVKSLALQPNIIAPDDLPADCPHVAAK